MCSRSRPWGSETVDDGAVADETATEPRPLRRLELTVTGRVQGVGFRVFVLDTARRLGLTGWVANEAHGSVRVVAEGPEPRLAALRQAVADGPAGARVEHVAEAWGPATGSATGFSIRSGGHSGD